LARVADGARIVVVAPRVVWLGFISTNVAYTGCLSALVRRWSALRSGLAAVENLLADALTITTDVGLARVRRTVVARNVAEWDWGWAQVGRRVTDPRIKALSGRADDAVAGRAASTLARSIGTLSHVRAARAIAEPLRIGAALQADAVRIAFQRVVEAGQLPPQVSPVDARAEGDALAELRMLHRPLQALVPFGPLREEQFAQHVAGVEDDLVPDVAPLLALLALAFTLAPTLAFPTALLAATVGRLLRF
jgi:hypothetical protein